MQKALLAELVPQCSIEPRSSRAGPSCACLPAVPVRQTVPFAGLSCRIKRGAVHRCGHGCCAGTRALAHCNPALPLPRTTSTHGHALCADLEERVLARRGTQPGAQFFHGKCDSAGVFGKFPKIAPGGARGDSFVRCHVKVIPDSSFSELYPRGITRVVFAKAVARGWNKKEPVLSELDTHCFVPQLA